VVLDAPPTPVLPGLPPTEPSVVADPVPAVLAQPLPPIAPSQAAAQPASGAPAQANGDQGATVIAVQLGDYGSQTGVDAGWQLMRRLYPDALGGVQLLQSAEPDAVRRPLLAGPFSEIGALAVCARLIADGQACRVTQTRL